MSSPCCVAVVVVEDDESGEEGMRSERWDLTYADISNNDRMVRISIPHERDEV